MDIGGSGGLQGLMQQLNQEQVSDDAEIRFNKKGGEEDSLKIKKEKSFFSSASSRAEHREKALDIVNQGLQTQFGISSDEASEMMKPMKEKGVITVGEFKELMLQVASRNSDNQSEYENIGPFKQKPADGDDVVYADVRIGSNGSKPKPQGEDVIYSDLRVGSGSTQPADGDDVVYADVRIGSNGSKPKPQEEDVIYSDLRVGSGSTQPADGDDVVYADVRIGSNGSKPKPQEEDVIYSDLRVDSNRSPASGTDEPIYAEVKKNRDR